MIAMRHPSRALAALAVYGLGGGVKVTNGRGLAAVAADINRANSGDHSEQTPTHTEAPAAAAPPPGDITAAFCQEYATKFAALADASSSNLPFAKRAREIAAQLFMFAGKLKEREATDNARKARAQRYGGYQG